MKSMLPKTPVSRKLFYLSFLIFVFMVFAGLFYSVKSSANTFPGISGDENGFKFGADIPVGMSENTNINNFYKSVEETKLSSGEAEHLTTDKSPVINSDSNTLLSLHFDNNLNGEQGEAPLSSSGFSYQTGIQNQSVFLGNPNQLTYSSQGNVNALEGTFEFWIKPNWNGNDNFQHTIFQWGSGGGILICKDGANNLRIILNRFGSQPGGERGVAFNVAAWQASQWHHVAFTYSNTEKSLKIFIDGVLKNSTSFTGNLPNISDSVIQVGSDSTSNYQTFYLNSGLDDLIVSDTARSEQEISQRYLAYLFSSLTFNPSPVVGGQSTSGTISLINPPLNDLTVSLSSSNVSALSVPPVVTISANARSATFPISTNTVANAVPVTVTATSADNSINAQINVVPPCQTTLPPQIISLWSGNDNGLDSVGSANNLTWNSFADGKVGRAFSFGSNDRFDTGFSKSVQEVPNFTFEAWIRPTNLNGSILDDIGGNNNRSKLITLSSGIFQISGGITNFSADLNQWQHIAFVITPTTIYFYKNGVQFSTPNTYNTILRNPGYELYLGRNAGSTFNSFVGQMDEPAIYSRALSQAEIQAIYDTGSLGKCYTTELQLLTINPISLETGSPATGTITLANIAPVGGAQISLTNSDETLATIPASITIPAGESQITFPITTLPSTRIKSLNISTIYQSSVRSALLTVTSSPDLQVTNITSPSEAITGTSFNVNAEITNTGMGIAEGNINNQGTFALARWDDFIYFSRDNQVGDDVRLTLLTSPSNTLNPNQIYTQNFNVTIPPSAVTQDGDYYIYVRTNMISGAPSYVRNESNTSNNVTFRPIHVSNAAPDLQVTNLVSPPQIVYDAPFQFSWSDKNAGTRTAVGYWRDKVFISADTQIDANDFVLGEFEFNDSIDPNQLIVRTKTLTIPSNHGLPNGKLYLIVQVDSTNTIIEGANENNNTAFTSFEPDLQITASTVPLQTETDANFSISWTDKNLGNLTANAPWTDKILLSNDNQPSSDDRLLGNYPLINSLNPNQTADRIQTISIPRNLITQDGDYFLIIQTDADNNINEGSNENNNFLAKPINIRKTPFPDLTIQNITAPDTAFFGQTIRIQWTVKNIGNGPTNAAGWQDWYYISSDNVPEIEDPFKAPLQNISYLAAGESYTASADITIPQGLVGTYKVIVYTDFDGTNHRGQTFSVKEADENNNWNFARPIQINAPPLPDLQTTLVQAQEEAFAGQAFNLNWRVENRGDGTTPPNVTAWNDKIYLSQNTTFEPNIDRLIGSRPHDGRLLATEGYSVNNFSVTLPNDIAGNWYVFVVADGDNQIFEFGNENNNDNYDREQPGSPVRINATPPDLIVPNVISAPTSGTAAGQITVAWTVRNQGAFDAAPNWFDTVYLSSDQTLDPAGDVALSTIARNNPLGAGLTYDATANVALPSCISGNYYLYVYADSRKQIFEYDPTFDAEANNFSQAKQITITSSPGDLQVTAVANPVSGVAGQPAAFSWTVANQGTGATLNTVWNDEVYLSPTANFVKANSTSIGAFTHTGALAVSGSYSQTQNIVIPNTAQGNYYVFVLTDANDNVEECGAANNDNSGGSSTIFNVSNSLPDLTVSNFGFANSFIAGQNVNVTWTVANSGTAAAQNSSWGDSVYFSTNNVLDGNDRKLTDVVVEGGLSPSGTYTKNAQVLLPIVAPGSYFLIVKTDNGDNVFEGQGENNNTRTLVLPVDVPPVDLQVTAVNAPANVFSGQSLTVGWTIQNTGSGQTVGANWTDAVVLSLDQIDDPTDRVIGYLQHEGALGGGANYTATTDVAVPSGLAGQYYIFIRADRNNQLAESNENNNSSSPKPVTLQLAPPSDLIVTNVVQPATASPGESATFNWTVQNIGANPATGLWTDTVYLSSDQTWDIGDVLVGRYTAGVNVAPGQTYNGTLSTALPAVNLGNYYVIVRTDIRNRVIETNENNNIGASDGTTTVDVPVLQLGVPQSTTLVTGQERFYKFNAPASETVRVSLDGQDGSSNELYTRFGQMASRNAYDFLFDRLYEPDQQLLIPNTNAGTYYNLISADYIPTSNSNLTVTMNNLNSKAVKSDVKNDIQSSATQNATIKAEILPFGVQTIAPNRGGNAGEVTVVIKGAKFDIHTIIKLVKDDNEITPSWFELKDSNTLYATFNLTGKSPGFYTLRAKSEFTYNDVNVETGEVFERYVLKGENSLVNGFEIVSGGGPIDNSQLLLPNSAIRNRVFSYNLLVKNDGLNDMKVPLLSIFSPNNTKISMSRSSNKFKLNQVQIMVQGKVRKDTLAPGETVIVPLYSIASTEPKSRFKLETFASNDSIDWANLESYYRTSAPSQEWNQTWLNLRQIVGSSKNDLQKAMRQAALYRQQSSSSQFYTGEQLMQDLLTQASLGIYNLGQFHPSGTTIVEDKKVLVTVAEKKRRELKTSTVPCGQTDPVHFFCSVKLNPVALFNLEAWARGPGVALVAARDGIDSSDTLDSYLGGECPNDIPLRREYLDGNYVSNSLRDSDPAREELRNFLEQFGKAITSSCPNTLPFNLPDREKTPVSMEEALRFMQSRNFGATYWFDQETGKVAASTNYTSVQYGTILLGGAGASNFGQDKRLLTGNIFLTVYKGKGCKQNVVNRISLETDVRMDIIDAFDFCPGDLGTGGNEFGTFLINALTKPLAILEGNNWAFDVPIFVSFKTNKEFRNLTGADFPENCDTGTGKLPPNSCSLPQNTDECETGSNSSGGSCQCHGDCDDVDNVNPSDPNEKTGPKGYGLLSYIAKQNPSIYTINFENVPTATASAQRVRVADQLDPNVDPRTFRLKEIGFGSYRLQVPENRAFFQQRVQLGAEFNNILADISAGVDISTGKVTWTLTAIDPATGEQPNSANLGLLAPNDETGRGQGFVTYTVQPKQNAPTGTVIRNNATIIFDTEEPITTNTVTNTLDADIPTSAVNALPAYQSNPAFTVSWAGTDAVNGSGLQNYDIWVAEDDGAYQPFVSGTTDTSATFTGIMGKTYKFYSIARDNAGNVEAAPAVPDATTKLYVPTAANVTLGGRVTTRTGRGISGAMLKIVNQNGQTRTALTNPFGYYNFANLAAGQTYVISVGAKGYTFAGGSQVRSVTEDVAGVNFTAN